MLLQLLTCDYWKMFNVLSSLKENWESFFVKTKNAIGFLLETLAAPGGILSQVRSFCQQSHG